jgi:hypothetical protein
LIVGHFSTVGDTECLDIVRQWCETEGLPYEVAAYSPRIRAQLSGAIDPASADPQAYSHVVVVCGPCWPEFLRKRGFNLDRFSHCTRIGVNLTMVKPIGEWNPFDVLLERDSDRAERADLTFLTDDAPAVIAGRCLIREQPEYGDRQRHQLAIHAIDALAARAGLTVLDLDTRWAEPGNSLRSPRDFAGVLARTDLLLTNRLHGLVFALRCGVPAIAIDGVAGGDKVMSQARAIGWPKAVCADQATPEWLDEAAAWCRTAEARREVAACRDRARTSLAGLPAAFAQALRRPMPPTPPHRPGAIARLRGLFVGRG